MSSPNAPGLAGNASTDTDLKKIYSTDVAGTTYSVPPKIELQPMAVVEIEKGDVIVPTATGYAKARGTGGSANISGGETIGVAIEGVDNTGGTARGVSIPGVFAQRQQVTAAITEAVNPGDTLKVGGNGNFDKWDQGTDDIELQCARYIGLPPGKYVGDKNTTQGTSVGSGRGLDGERFNPRSDPEVSLTAAGVGIVELI